MNATVIQEIANYLVAGEVEKREVKKVTAQLTGFLQWKKGTVSKKKSYP